MRKAWLGLVFFYTLGMAGPLSLCDYRPPETALLDVGLSLAYHYYDDPGTAGIDLNSGNISLSYSQIYSSPEQGFSLNGSGSFDLMGFALAEANAEAAGTYRYYLVADEPFFGFGGFEAIWSTRYVQPGIEARAGLGYGRFYDVTPLAKALLIEEDLLRSGAIPASLSDGTLMAIAQEIGRIAEYEGIADLVAEVERLIEAEAGVELDARALLRVEERIKETGRERFCGGAIQAGLGYEVMDPLGEARDFVLSGSADWAVAPEPRSQLLIRVNTSAPLPWTGAYTLSLTATYDYQLNETTSFTAKYSLQQVNPPGGSPAGRQSALFNLGLNLHGWKVSLQLSFGKTAEAPGWTQEFIVSAGIDLR